MSTTTRPLPRRRDKSSQRCLRDIRSAGRTGFALKSAPCFKASSGTTDAETIRLLRQQLDAAQASLALYTMATNQMAHGLSMFGADHRLLLANTRYREIWSLPAELGEPGAGFEETTRAAQGREWLPKASSHDARPEGVAGAGNRREWLLDDGRCIAVTAVNLSTGENVALHEDVTERYQAQQRVAHLTRYDVLTGTANLNQLRVEIDSAMACLQTGEEVALLCLEIDRFKLVNDTLGFAAGETVLQLAAERLRRCVRSGDVLARPASDEFSVLQLRAAQPGSADLLARRLLDAFNAPFEVNGQVVHLDASIGVAIGPHDGTPAGELLKNANLAMARAKQEGGSRFCYFEAGMDTRVRELHRTENDLRGALPRDEFELAFQPQVLADSGAVVGVEALLRWNHPTRGRVSPVEFIPLAEETSLIVPIGAWVLRNACIAAAKWPPEVRVSVNVSPVQIRHPSLLEDVKQALRSSGLPAGRLELEITEAVLLRDTEQALGVLHDLRNLGVCIAMDDFGTGYSSLSYLRRFPFDRIKIDRSFVSHVESNPDALAIIKAITGLGASLGMATTVEGVETMGQYAAVVAAGCREIQGYLYSKPRPASEILAVIQMGIHLAIPPFCAS